MDRKAEEEAIAELWVTTTTQRGALRGPRSRLKIYGTAPRRYRAVIGSTVPLAIVATTRWVVSLPVSAATMLSRQTS